MKDAAAKIEQELADLGLDDEPPTEPEIPPENQDEPVGVDDPADEPADTDREHAARTAQALARAVDQLAVSFEEVRRAAHALCEALEPRRGTLNEYSSEAKPDSTPDVSVDADDSEEPTDGEEDDGSETA
jgi:phage protein D